MTLTIAFIGCSKLKAEVRRGDMVPARDLYVGELFRKRVEYVESRKIPWYILSAKSGLLKPSCPIWTYDQEMVSLSEIDTQAWHIGVASQFLEELYWEHGSPRLRDVVVELHAGKAYCEPLDRVLEISGIKSIRPVRGLGIGKQLSYYSERVLEPQ